MIACVSLCLVLISVLVVFSLSAQAIHILFAPYQFFLIGICIGALVAVTFGLIIERGKWGHYRLYLLAVMASVFVLVVANSVIYRLLGGEQFLRRLIRILLLVFTR